MAHDDPRDKAGRIASHVAIVREVITGLDRACAAALRKKSLSREHAQLTGSHKSPSYRPARRPPGSPPEGWCKHHCLELTANRSVTDSLGSPILPPHYGSFTSVYLAHRWR